MSETNWLNPPQPMRPTLVPAPKRKMRVFFTTGYWVEYGIVDEAEFHNMVNCIRSQGMLLTKTSYIPAHVIGWIVVTDEHGNPIGDITTPPPPPLPAATAPGSETPQ